MRYKLIILAGGLFLFKINTWLIRQQAEIRNEQEKIFMHDELSINRDAGVFFSYINQISRDPAYSLPECMKAKAYERIMDRPIGHFLDYYKYLQVYHHDLELKPLPSGKWIPAALDTTYLEDFAEQEIQRLLEKNKWLYSNEPPMALKCLVHSVKMKGEDMLVVMDPFALITDAKIEALVNGKYLVATNPLILKKNEKLISWRIQNPVTNEYQHFKHQ